ncbi:30S ribosomal protein S20 [Candidatus Saccharibacteria bacterium]|nr:30S ribosomal protein S20 [Candidatus Saccharibacteria bacterium]
MPHTKSASKNLRKSRKRAAENQEIKEELKGLLKKSVTKKTLPTLYKKIDKAVKRNIFSAQKAARLKSRLAKEAS